MATFKFLSPNFKTNFFTKSFFPSSSSTSALAHNSPASLSLLPHSSSLISTLCAPTPFSAPSIGKSAFKKVNGFKNSGILSIRAMSKSSSDGKTHQPETERLVQHLLVKEDQLQFLHELQKQLVREGLDLSDLAQEHSVCPSKKDGGMIGWIRRGQTVPEFEEVAFGSPLNKIVRVKTKYGWHLVQALSERAASFLEQITPEDMMAKLKDLASLDEVQLIDVRERSEIELASVPEFKVYPLSEFGNWAPSITEELDLNKETYVMCHHGVRSQQAAQWLKSQGFMRLFNVTGGIDRYSRKVDPSIPTY